MKVVFLANSFHLKKTKSADFFIDLLRQWFDEVAVIPHKEVWAKHQRTNCDLLISWQHLWQPEELEAFGARRTVLVPMYDDCPHDQTSWEPYLGFRILSFSRTLGDDLKAWGHDVMTVQYWQPLPPSRTPATGLRGFFWPRTRALGWSQIKTLLGDATWESFHLHVTNEEGASSQPDPSERQRFRIEQTAWFENPADAQAAVAHSSVYFAPRRYEGIGQAVLEAMAQGLCVVAPNEPTMNEYIVSGQTGILYDPDCPTALDFSRWEALGVQARQAAVEGRARWEASESVLREFLSAPSLRAARFRPWIIMKGRLVAMLRAVFRWFKRMARRA